jgi:hypothetical protein
MRAARDRPAGSSSSLTRRIHARSDYTGQAGCRAGNLAPRHITTFVEGHAAEEGHQRGPAQRKAAVTGAAGRPDLALFGEAPTRVVVTCAPAKVAELEAILGDLPRHTVGRVAGTDLRCTMESKELFAVPVSELHSAYESLPERLA